MTGNLLVLALLSLEVLCTPLWGQQPTEPTRPWSSVGRASAGSEMPVFGPYQAIAINRDIVNDVKVDEELNVHLQLFPAHKDKQLVVKISNERFSSYREWFYGGYELLSPANAGKPSYGWTDWVQTKAKYIEYWMDGQVFLHLMRRDL